MRVNILVADPLAHKLKCLSDWRVLTFREQSGVQYYKQKLKHKLESNFFNIKAVDANNWQSRKLKWANHSHCLFIFVLFKR